EARRAAQARKEQAMTEQPNVLLVALLTLTGTFAAILVGALLLLGVTGIIELVATVVGSFSACVYFLAELRRVPVTALTIVVPFVVSVAAFLRAALLFRRQQRVLNGLPL